MTINTDQDKFLIMLNILQRFDSKYGHTKEELSSEFGKSVRTIERYIETFKNVGYDIVKTKEI
ncbi:HTH domain-containing protein [Prolixibacteraceae bacterium]|nr:HTH domain-containing protein [Prolixibacteraceae bacterium]